MSTDDPDLTWTTGDDPPSHPYREPERTPTVAELLAGLDLRVAYDRHAPLQRLEHLEDQAASR